MPPELVALDVATDSASPSTAIATDTEVAIATDGPPDVSVASSELRYQSACARDHAAAHAQASIDSPHIPSLTPTSV